MYYIPASLLLYDQDTFSCTLFAPRCSVSWSFTKQFYHTVIIFIFILWPVWKLPEQITSCNVKYNSYKTLIL